MFDLATAACAALVLTTSVAGAQEKLVLTGLLKQERFAVGAQHIPNRVRPILINETATPSPEDELAAWTAVQANATSTSVLAFLNDFPDGAFAQQARELFVDVLAQERGAPVETSPEPQPTAEAEPEVTAPEPETAQVDETEAQAPVAVSFSAPLAQGDPAIVGKSLEELIKGSPLFPPIEGLPESYWQEVECSSCHQWEQANLCDQANTYLSDAGSANLTKQHPYGGTFKKNLVFWADGGCQ